LTSGGAYNLLRVKEGDESKTAFITKYGQFEFFVMPFGLANAPAQFQKLMNEVFRNQIRNFALIYQDDVVVYSERKEDHWGHFREVLQILKDNNLYCAEEKCHFGKRSINYLGYVISDSGIDMDPKKVAVIQEWPVPSNLKELQVFLGFTNFYRRLIVNYASLASGLITSL